MRQFTGTAWVNGKRHSSFNVTFTRETGKRTWTAQFGGRQQNAKVTGVTLPNDRAGCRTVIVSCLRTVLKVGTDASVTIKPGSWIRFE